jgi:hypothetical protein
VHILVSTCDAPSQPQAPSTAYYRCNGQLVSEPLTLPLATLRERVALEPAPAPAALAQHPDHVGAVFRVPVRWALANAEERHGAEADPEQLLAFRHPLRPVWKWSKAKRTGFWRVSLDDALDAGWWEAGSGLDLVVCGVEDHRATELQGKWTQVFPLTEHQMEGKE